MSTNIFQKEATASVQWWKNNKHGGLEDVLHIALYFCLRALGKTTKLFCCGGIS